MSKAFRRTMIYSGTIDIPGIKRKHIYEGFTEDDIAHDLLGVDRLVIVSAVGSLNSDLKVGDIVAIKDLITVFYQSTHIYRDFIDLNNPYEKTDLKEVTHVFVRGPHYETWADKRVLQNMGADVVGMSILPETIVCKRLGIPCIALGVVTNDPFVIHKHEDVVKATKNATNILKGILARLGEVI